MGASFQTPCAAPRQRQMETLSWVDLVGCSQPFTIIIVRIIMIIIRVCDLGIEIICGNNKGYVI